MKKIITRSESPTLWVSIIPVAVLLVSIIGLIYACGASLIQDYSYIILLGAAAVCVLLSLIFTNRKKSTLYLGLVKSARQILPAVIILFFIGTLSATWMLSGVVPTLIDYGLGFLNPKAFLLIACAVCAVCV